MRTRPTLFGRSKRSRRPFWCRVELLVRAPAPAVQRSQCGRAAQLLASPLPTMSFFRPLAPLAVAACLLAAPLRAQTGTGAADDPFLWLEELHGERAMSWVRAENA